MKKQYFGARRITATPMTRAAYNEFRGWKVPSDENQNDEGFLIEDHAGVSNHPAFKGYISWVIKNQFEATYRPIDGMSFGLAIEALKLGDRVSRAGWNGKGMFLFAVPGSESKVNQFSLKDTYPENARFTIRPHINMFTVDGEVVPWVASQTDILADDWRIV